MRHRSREWRFSEQHRVKTFPRANEALQFARSSLLRLEKQWPRQSVAEQPSSSTESDVGEFGKFRIHDELGQGASGVVLLATDTTTGQKVALKLPKFDAVFDPELRKRFCREAELVQGLKHRGLLPVYEAGECNGIFYIASTYSYEVSLDAFVERQTEPPSDQICTPS